MASSPTPVVPQLYSFLGDDLAKSFVGRVFAAQGFDSKEHASYYEALVRNTIEKLDNFVLEKLSTEDIEKIYLLKATLAPQNIITDYLNLQIPNLNIQLNQFLDQEFDRVNQKHS